MKNIANANAKFERSFSGAHFIVDQGGHGTGKTGNLDVNFSRQGKHREFSKFSSYTGKIMATLRKFCN